MVGCLVGFVRVVDFGFDVCGFVCFQKFTYFCCFLVYGWGFFGFSVFDRWRSCVLCRVVMR